MTEYYISNTDNCTNNELDYCLKTLPNPGFKLKDKDGLFSEFKDNENLDKIIPFLTERKYKFYSASSKNDSNRHESNYFDTTTPLIKKIYNTEFQPDDIVKNNLVNNFSYNILGNIRSLYENIIAYITKTEVGNSSVKLDNYYSDDIRNLQKELNNLNNKNLNEETVYTNKYYDTNSYKFKINLLTNCIFIVSIILIISILDNNGIIKYGFAINVILIIALLIYFTLSLYDMSDRQYSNWDKKYFNYVNKVSDKV